MGGLDMRGMRGKRAGRAFALFALSLFFAIRAFAKDTVSTISSVRITVEDSLKELEADDPRPYISASDFTTPETDRYSVDYAQWYDSNESDSLTVGTAPKVVVYLTSGYKEKSNGDEIDYRFYGTYTASNVRVSGGTFVSAQRNGYDELQVVIQLKGVTGEFSVPERPSWRADSLGYATWEAPENTSGYYAVTLNRDTKKIVTITTDALALNLHPWMESEGDYTFSVQTIPYTEEQKRLGKKSETVESDVQTITTQNKSNGAGKYDTTQVSGSGAAASGSTSSTSASGSAANPVSSDSSSGANTSGDTVGWYKENGNWYFRYPSKALAISTWLDWNGKWYHFDQNGKMETGWFENAYHKLFYLDKTSGAMKTGWQQIDGVWYYFNPVKGDSEGAMFQSTFGHVGEDYYYFDARGHMCTGWTSIKDSTGTEQYYYFYEDGKLARNTSIDGFKIDESGKWVH